MTNIDQTDVDKAVYEQFLASRGDGVMLTYDQYTVLATMLNERKQRGVIVRFTPHDGLAITVGAACFALKLADSVIIVMNDDKGGETCISEINGGKA